MLVKLIVICLLYINADGAALSSKDDKKSPKKMFEDFMKTYNRTYANPDIKLMRFEKFKVNLKYIEKLNERHPHATFGITNSADLSYEERNNMISLLGLNFEEMQANASAIPEYMKRFSSTPKSIDWRDRNGVTPVKDQGPCGSCWAFSAVAAIESQYAIKHKKIIDLSEQQLVDCVTESEGCDGGNPNDAIIYVIDNGLMLEKDYPYNAVQGECLNKTKKSVVSIKNEIYYDAGVSEKIMEHYVATYGPLSIAIYVRDEYNFYKSGIMTPLPEECKEKPNHGVLLVGYGEENGVPYWLIKNSWGTNFGEEGYFKIVRGEEICSINIFILIFHLN